MGTSVEEKIYSTTKYHLANNLRHIMKFCLVLLALALIAQAEKFPEPKCEKNQMACAGEWKDGKQLTADDCIDMKIGDCDNHCPTYCNGKDEEICAGKVGEDGCKMPDMCHAKGTCPKF